MSALRRTWYALCRQVARLFFAVVFGIRVYGRERLPETGGVLVVSNHQSYLDPILAAVGMARPFQPMARASLFRMAPFRWLIRSLYAFPVRRGTADLAAMREALRRLRAGGVVLVFPEGTRTRDGSIGRLLPGPVALAGRAKVPIVPMVIDGAFEAWPRSQAIPWPHRIRVACGRPVHVESDAEAEGVMERVRDDMCELQAQLRTRRRRAEAVI